MISKFIEFNRSGVGVFVEAEVCLRATEKRDRHHQDEQKVSREDYASRHCPDRRWNATFPLKRQ